MKDATELLTRIIAHETKHVGSMRHTLKEDELTILRLQNKARILEIEIDDREQLINEYRGYLKEISEATDVRMKLVPSTRREADMKSSTSELELIKA